MSDTAQLREEAQRLLDGRPTSVKGVELRTVVRLGLAILDRLEHLDRAVAFLNFGDTDG